jgi:hypothetical protein
MKPPEAEPNLRSKIEQKCNTPRRATGIDLDPVDAEVTPAG